MVASCICCVSCACLCDILFEIYIIKAFNINENICMLCINFNICSYIALLIPNISFIIIFEFLVT